MTISVSIKKFFYNCIGSARPNATQPKLIRQLDLSDGVFASDEVASAEVTVLVPSKSIKFTLITAHEKTLSLSPNIVGSLQLVEYFLCIFNEYAFSVWHLMQPALFSLDDGHREANSKLYYVTIVVYARISVTGLAVCADP